MLSALDLVRRVEAGELTPRAVVDICAEAIAAGEPQISAFAALDLAAARQAAEAPDLAARPLRGLPVGMKDIFDTADLPTQYGSRLYAGHRPRADAAAVAMVRRAGGLILGKTVTTEFASLVPAGTRNPRDPAHTPGGSSSGSAAAVAAAMLPLALGSQTGGSVIRPAAFCGIVGFKPSYQLIPTVGMKAFSWHLDTVGLFAAGVADIGFAAAAITDRDLRVDRGVPAAPRFALVRTHSWPQASAAMQAAVEAAARAAEKAGATVNQLRLPPLLEEAHRLHRTIQDYEAFQALAYEYDHHRDALGQALREQLDRAAAITAAEYDAARGVAKRARAALGDWLSGHDAILTPSAPGAAPHGLASTGDPVFNRLWTLMGTPCVNMPVLRESELPLGLQIVGRFGRDRAALEAALFLETAIKPK